MRFTIERLRTTIVILAAMLLGAILLFFAYARYRVRHFAKDLPAKLGIEIQQSTNGFTFSKSEKGHTLFTLHASKAVQYKGAGRATLHDVSITLFDKQGAPADHIAGSEFDYDPKSGIARATGPVEIDVAAPAGNGGGGAGQGGASKPIRLRTSGLVFNQKTGTAATEEQVDFLFSGAQGSARGASYDSASGVMVLREAVHFRSEIEGGPVEVRAAHAQFNRSNRQLSLQHDAVDYSGNHTTSDAALVRFRPDGTAERVNAQGEVHLTGQNGRDLRAGAAVISMNAQGKPQTASFSGGTAFAAQTPEHALHGNANEATLRLRSGELEHIRLNGAASLLDEQQGASADARGPVTRQVSGAQIDVDFVQGGNGHAQAQRVAARGGARASERTVPEKTVQDKTSQDKTRQNKAAQGKAGPQETAIEGDELVATLQGGRSLKNLSGAGHTVLVNKSGNGVEQTSRGDVLEVNFSTPERSPAARKRAQKDSSGAGHAGRVERAVQRGHVEVVQTEPGVAGAAGMPPTPRRVTATAEQASYEAMTDTVHLEGGSPRLVNADSDLTASVIDMSRASGLVTATGEVKATYRAADPEGEGGAGATRQAKEPVHVVAARGVFDRRKDQANFYADGRGVARLWQGSSSITAPELVLSQKLQTLEAQGGGGTARVQAVFAGHAEAVPASGGAQASGQGSVVRVESAALLYSGAENKGTFSGRVVAQEREATVHAEKLNVFLQGETAEKGTANGKAGLPNVSAAVERVVAEGHVTMEQPGRRGSGTKLVYTGESERFVLTGTAAEPPRVVDEAHGAITGASLIFNNRDGSVVVSGDTSRTVTDTRAPK